ncbi:hypothetical protein BQ8482_290128 [Mesorhizobium delmotii]|uniref:Uncharacterized protein n=1 Tax=Mesorhizobium delmotii TaxID=1631247 RepID=A0A2P9AN09_9HYPH|nr:hypothetical protein BQ8482_290128 [Mesorhizobium delmotii]
MRAIATRALFTPLIFGVSAVRRDAEMDAIRGQRPGNMGAVAELIGKSVQYQCDLWCSRRLPRYARRPASGWKSRWSMK